MIYSGPLRRLELDVSKFKSSAGMLSRFNRRSYGMPVRDNLYLTDEGIVVERIGADGPGGDVLMGPYKLSWETLRSLSDSGKAYVRGDTNGTLEITAENVERLLSLRDD